MINWHRLFGIALIEFFSGSPYEVELEKDLSVKRQLLDIVIIRRTGDQWDHPLPDGFDNLADHNLITYKSLHEPLDDWALKELTGHYVNYRKQVSPSLTNLLPEDRFQLYGICTRFPDKLTHQMQMFRIHGGVYDLYRGSDRIRLIILSEIEDAAQNRIWELFGGIPDRIATAIQDFDWEHGEASTILNQLLEHYQMEGLKMPYTMEDFRRDFILDHLREVPPQEIAKRLSPDERLEGLPPDELLKHLAPEERLKGLPSNELLKHLALDERLKNLPPEELSKSLTVEGIQAYLKKLLERSDSDTK